jgi:hypothetical protein
VFSSNNASAAPCTPTMLRPGDTTHCSARWCRLLLQRRSRALHGVVYFNDAAVGQSRVLQRRYGRSAAYSKNNTSAVYSKDSATRQSRVLQRRYCHGTVYSNNDTTVTPDTPTVIGPDSVAPCTLKTRRPWRHVNDDEALCTPTTI